MPILIKKKSIISIKLQNIRQICINGNKKCRSVLFNYYTELLFNYILKHVNTITLCMQVFWFCKKNQ